MKKKHKRIGLRRIFFDGAVIIAVVFAAILVFPLLSPPKVKDLVTIEAGAEADVKEFLVDEKDTGVFETDMNTINSNMPGVYDVFVKVDEKSYESKLKVVDTTPPAATVLNHEIWNDETIEAKEFVKDIIDATEVKVYYKERPDFTKIGVNKVTIVLEDTSNNKMELTATLKVIADTEAPEIIGTKDQTVYIDSKISYKKDVT